MGDTPGRLAPAGEVSGRPPRVRPRGGVDGLDEAHMDGSVPSPNSSECRVMAEDARAEASALVVANAKFNHAARPYATVTRQLELP